MAQYIDKSALVVEIKRLLNRYISVHTFNYGATQDLNHLLSFLDTIEVKEVGLEKEIKANQESDEVKIGETQIYLDDDGGEPPYDGKQWLDFSCMEYEIPSDKFKDGDNVEIFIRKTQRENNSYDTETNISDKEKNHMQE